MGDFSCIYTYFGQDLGFFIISKHVKTGKWSESLLTKIADKFLSLSMWALQNILSIKVAVLAEKRVGNVAWGSIPHVINISK